MFTCVFNPCYLQKSTVQRWINRYVSSGSVETFYKNCHRPRITTDAIDHEITEYVHENPFTTSSSLANDFGISPWTIRRRLKEDGLFHFIPATQTKLSQEQKDRRVEFCEENYGINWDFVIFSDEKTFKSCNDRAKSLWRPKNQRYNPLYIQETTYSGRITCGVWGFITRGGVGELSKISAHMNSQEYTAILDEVFLPSINSMYGDSATEFQFQQDNARMHTSYHTRAWFESHPEVICLEWPVKSPDLNLIENVWAKMVWGWPDGGFSNRDEIFYEAEERWNSLRGTEYMANLYESIPKRLDEVINNGGNWCRY